MSNYNNDDGNASHSNPPTPVLRPEKDVDEESTDEDAEMNEIYNNIKKNVFQAKGLGDSSSDDEGAAGAAVVASTSNGNCKHFMLRLGL